MSVPRIPLARVGHLVGEQVASVVTGVVRLAEDIVVVSISLVGLLDGLIVIILIGVRGGLIGCKVLIAHDVGACLIFHTVYLTGDAVRVGLLYKQLSLCSRQQIPVPIADWVVCVVCLVVDDHLLAVLQLHVGCRIVCIAVGLHFKQFHLAVRCCSDGQRYIHGLAEGIR